MTENAYVKLTDKQVIENVEDDAYIVGIHVEDSGKKKVVLFPVSEIGLPNASAVGSLRDLDNDPEIADTTELLAFKLFCENKSVWRVLFALYAGEDKTPANTFFVDDNGDILTDENNAIITDEEGVLINGRI